MCWPGTSVSRRGRGDTAEQITSRCMAEYYFGPSGRDVPGAAAALLDELAHVIGNPLSLPASLPTPARVRISRRANAMRRLVHDLLQEDQPTAGKRKRQAAELAAKIAESNGESKAGSRVSWSVRCSPDTASRPRRLRGCSTLSTAPPTRSSATVSEPRPNRSASGQAGWRTTGFPGGRHGERAPVPAYMAHRPHRNPALHPGGVRVPARPRSAGEPVRRAARDPRSDSSDPTSSTPCGGGTAIRDAAATCPSGWVLGAVLATTSPRPP